MKICLSHIGGNIIAQARAESDDGETIGDATATIEPGQEFFGHPFADILALGEGEHDISEKE